MFGKVAIVVMDNGIEYKLNYGPDDLVERITDKDGIPYDRFIEIYEDTYINPKHISIIRR